MEHGAESACLVLRARGRAKTEWKSDRRSLTFALATLRLCLYSPGFASRLLAGMRAVRPWSPCILIASEVGTCTHLVLSLFVPAPLLTSAARRDRDALGQRGQQLHAAQGQSGGAQLVDRHAQRTAAAAAVRQAKALAQRAHRRRRRRDVVRALLDVATAEHHILVEVTAVAATTLMFPATCP